LQPFLFSFNKETQPNFSPQRRKGAKGAQRKTKERKYRDMKTLRPLPMPIVSALDIHSPLPSFAFPLRLCAFAVKSYSLTAPVMPAT
jgi:hypothetical protein